MSSTKTDEQIKKVKQFSNRRRDPRVMLSPLHKVEFKEKSGQASRGVYNISASGIGVQSEGKDKWSSGDQVEGEITIEKERFPALIQVAHVSDKAVGCEIIKPTEVYRKAVEAYFNVELAALNLKLDQSNLDESEGHKIYNFSGPNNCELLVVESPDELVRYKVIVFGNVFSGGKDLEISAGQLISSVDFDDFTHNDYQQITKLVTEIDPETLNALKAFVQNIGYLNSDYKNLILKDLNNFPVKG